MVEALLAAGALAGVETLPMEDDPISRTPASIAERYGRKELAD